MRTVTRQNIMRFDVGDKLKTANGVSVTEQHLGSVFRANDVFIRAERETYPRGKVGAIFWTSMLVEAVLGRFPQRVQSSENRAHTPIRQMTDAR